LPGESHRQRSLSGYRVGHRGLTHHVLSYLPLLEGSNSLKVGCLFCSLVYKREREREREKYLALNEYLLIKFMS